MSYQLKKLKWKSYYYGPSNHGTELFYEGKEIAFVSVEHGSRKMKACLCYNLDIEVHILGYFKHRRDAKRCVEMNLGLIPVLEVHEA